MHGVLGADDAVKGPCPPAEPPSPTMLNSSFRDEVWEVVFPIPGRISAVGEPPPPYH